MQRTPVAISNPLAKNVTSHSTVFPAPPSSTALQGACSDDLYQEVTCLHLLHLSPRHAMDMGGGVMQELLGRLLKYDRDIQGVPLVFSRVELTPAPVTQPIPLLTGYPTPQTSSLLPVTSAAIIAENPQLHLWVRVRWVAFCPSAGSRVVGSVVKQSPEQLNLLVLGLFNATVKREQLAGTLEWSEEAEAWTHPAQGRCVGLGDLLEFEVMTLRTDMNMLRLVGSLDKMQQPQVAKKRTKTKKA